MLGCLREGTFVNVVCVRVLGLLLHWWGKSSLERWASYGDFVRI